MTLTALWLGIGACTLAAQAAPRMPMKETVEDSARYRWENKPVLESRLLDDCERPETWFHDDFGEMSFSTERAKDGRQSVRLHSKTKGDKPTKDNRPWGYCSAIRKVDGEDWSRWNRISFWIYPDLPGHKTVSTYVLVSNRAKDGQKPVGSRDNILLKNQQWNHVVTEIEHLSRTNIGAVEIQCRLSGHEPGTSDTMTYYIDKLELQRVEPDHYQGWNVAPGKISFSHTGYSSGAPKSAIASDLSARTFKLIAADTGKPVLSKPVQSVKTYRGEFQLMDFSEMRKPGSYYIEAGDRKTRKFRIDDNVWRTPLTKAINFFYSERCGTAIPGVHDVCHQDWISRDGGKSVSVNGGWHDAGDLSQGLYNTAEAVYEMFSLVQQMQRTGNDKELSDRITEEAAWGLDWLLKTSFDNGQRPVWSVMGWWSNGIIGDNDDPRAGAGRGAFEFMTAAAAEALGYQILKNLDPDRAAQSLATARADWRFGLEHLPTVMERRPMCEGPSAAIIASVELFRATGEQKYADKALELAPLIVKSQEREFIPGSREPVTGFLYGSPEKDRILHVVSPGAREHHQLVALALLCEVFPNDKNWMEWYSGVALYAEYFYKKIVANTAPYGMLPGGIYTDDEHLQIWESARENYRQDVLAGQRIGDHHYVRAFPAINGFGNMHLVLTQAKGVSVGARLRGDLASVHLTERQLEWTLGRNPFSQSFMYGEGYDFVPQYFPMCGDMVGALPVGMANNGSIDEPYWPAGNNKPAQREPWVQTVSRFIYLMCDATGPALVEGRAKTDVQFKETTTGAMTSVKPDAAGNFRVMMPQGNYTVSADGFENHMTLLPGATGKFDPTLDFVVSSQTGKDGQVTIELAVSGKGTHEFSIRTDNLTLPESRKETTVPAGKPQKLVWQGQVANLNSPWFAVVVPNNNLAQRKESHGAVIPTTAKN